MFGIVFIRLPYTSTVLYRVYKRTIAQHNRHCSHNILHITIKIIKHIELLLRRRSTILSFIYFVFFFYISLEFIALVRLFFTFVPLLLPQNYIYTHAYTSHHKVSQNFQFSSSCRRCRQRSLCILRPLYVRSLSVYMLKYINIYSTTIS